MASSPMMDTSSGRDMSHASDKTLDTALQSGRILMDERTIIRYARFCDVSLVFSWTH